MRFDRGEVARLLSILAEAADRRGVQIDLFLIGGAAIAVGYSDTRVTDDIDGVFMPKDEVDALVAEIAAEQGLPVTWLNDNAKRFLPEYEGRNQSITDRMPYDPHASVLFDRPGLAVRVASPRYLFVLKALAARESDLDDLRLVWPHCGFEHAGDALAAIERMYPDGEVRPMTRRVVEAIAAELAR